MHCTYTQTLELLYHKIYTHLSRPQPPAAGTVGAAGATLVTDNNYLPYFVGKYCCLLRGRPQSVKNAAPPSALSPSSSHPPNPSPFTDTSCPPSSPSPSAHTSCPPSSSYSPSPSPTSPSPPNIFALLPSTILPLREWPKICKYIQSEYPLDIEVYIKFTTYTRQSGLWTLGPSAIVKGEVTSDIQI